MYRIFPYIGQYPNQKLYSIVHALGGFMFEKYEQISKYTSAEWFVQIMLIPATF